MLKLGVNIDHVGTLRQARYATMLDSPNAEPDIVAASLAARTGGAARGPKTLRCRRGPKKSLRTNGPGS